MRLTFARAYGYRHIDCRSLPLSLSRRRRRRVTLLDLRIGLNYSALLQYCS
jgi:hypothetical protein